MDGVAAEMLKTGLGNTEMLKMGPNDARHVVWVLSEFFFFFCHVLLTLYVLHRDGVAYGKPRLQFRVSNDAGRVILATEF